MSPSRSSKSPPLLLLSTGCKATGGPVFKRSRILSLCRQRKIEQLNQSDKMSFLNLGMLIKFIAVFSLFICPFNPRSAEFFFIKIMDLKSL